MTQETFNSRITRLNRTTLWAATPVPTQKNSQIDDDQLNNYANWLFQQPLGGVVINAHTGRGLHWSDTQRQHILNAWVKNRPSEKSIIAAVGAPAHIQNFLDALAFATNMAQQAQDLGADALMIHPPTFLKNDENIWQKCFAYHRSIIESVQIPSVLFYLYENAGGLSYPLDLIDDMLTLNQVYGIKVATLDSVMTFQDIAGLLKLHPNKKLITGEDRFLGYSLMSGAKAALIGMGSAFVKPQADLIQSHLTGNFNEFMKLNAIVDAFAQTTFCKPMEGYIARMLACLVHEGVLTSDAAHDPFGPSLQPGEFEKIGTILKVLKRRLEELANSR